MAETPPLSYCAQLVRQHDPDRFLCALFAPAERREALFAIYAFDVELAGIADLVSEPMAGMIRLQWWREAVAAGVEGRSPAQPVAEAVAAATAAHDLPTPVLGEMIDGRELELQPLPQDGEVNLDGYLEATAANTARLAARVLGVSRPPALEAARRVGLAWGLLGLVRVLGQGGGRARLLHSPDRNDPAKGATRVAAALGARAREHLAAARRLRPEVPRAALPALLPAALADHYLRRLNRAGGDPRRADLRRRPPLTPISLLFYRAAGRY